MSEASGTPDTSTAASGEAVAQQQATQQQTGPAPVPYERFKEVNDAKKALTDKTAELEAKLKEIEDKEKTELEKATEKAAEAERKALDLEAQIVTERRNASAVTAAVKANWADPSAAAKLIDWTQVEDEGDIAKLVADYAAANPWVVRSAGGSVDAGVRSEDAPSIEEQIKKAEEAGDINTSMALKLKMMNG